MSRYTVLVVDPPWSYGNNGKWRTGRVATAHYKTMAPAEIIAETPVREWAADNAHLYLWTTNPKLPFAFAMLDAWGFTYKTTLTWVKTTQAGGVHGGGMGWFYRGATEHVLFGVRGNKPIPSALRRPNVVLAQPTGHSVKPDAFYEMLEGVYGDGETLIDMFARRSRLGWTCWGDEMPNPEDLCLDVHTGVIKEPGNGK